MCKLAHNRATLRAPLFQTQPASTKSNCSQKRVHGWSAPSSKENSNQSRAHPPSTSLASSDFSSSLNEDESAQDLSLRAILSMCLPERPPVTVGALLRECIFGEVHLGSYPVPDVSTSNSGMLVPTSSPAVVSRPVVIKEFNLSQVLKKQSKRGIRLYEDALAELQIHVHASKYNVPNVIQLYAMHMDVKSSKLFAYMEYAAQGELFSLLHNRSACSPLPVSVATNFFVQILQGVRDLHAMNVVHRDLSLENLLLTADSTVKICDFGLAAICPPGTTISDRKVIGKVKYMCPEVFYGEEYDPRLVDVWSAGVIFFIMLTSVFPYYAPSVEDQGLVMLCNERINDMLMHWKMTPLEEEIVNVFAKIFCQPNKRWQAHQLLQLPFCQRFAQLPKEAVDQALKGDAVVQTFAPVVPIFRVQSLYGSSPALIHDAYNLDYVLASSSPLPSCSSTASTRPSSVLTESSRAISECSQEVELINSLSSSPSVTPSSNSAMSPTLSSSNNAIYLVHMLSDSSTYNDVKSSGGSSDQMEKEPWSPSAFRQVQKHASAEQCLVDSAAVLSRHYPLAESPLPTPRRLNLDFSLAF